MAAPKYFRDTTSNKETRKVTSIVITPEQHDFLLENGVILSVFVREKIEELRAQLEKQKGKKK